MTREDRIERLLYFYVDVEVGLQDRAYRSDDFLPRMSRAWNHPSYKELRRLIRLMQDTEPFLYWHISETFFRYQEVRVAECPKCGRQYAPTLGWDEDKDEGGFCKHGSGAVRLRPKTIRKISKAVRPFERELGIAWLERHFQGEPFIPDDLLSLVA